MASRIDSLARKQSSDHPMIVVYEVIGNDVCNGRKTFDAMTTPEEFEV